MIGERTTVGFVTPRHGAYLISVSQVANGSTEFAGPSELTDAASSLPRAKRVLIEMAREFGFGGAVRWYGDDGRWRLVMTNEGEE